MTLDEAIRHAEEVGERCDKCGAEHRQLAEWLRELRELRGISGDEAKEVLRQVSQVSEEKVEKNKRMLELRKGIVKE